MKRQLAVGMLTICALWAQTDVPPIGIAPPKSGNPRAAKGIQTGSFRVKLGPGPADVATLRVYKSREETLFRQHLTVELAAGSVQPSSWRLQNAAGVTKQLPAPQARPAGTQSTPADQSIFDDLFARPETVLLVATVPGAGEVRRPLRSVQQTVVIALMSTTVVAVQASARGGLMVEATRDQSGALETASVRYDVAYRFPSATGLKITGLDVTLRTGSAETVVLNSGLTESEDPDLRAKSIQLSSEVDLSNADRRAAIEALLVDPGLYALRLTTTASPTGALRGQLRNTERAEYRVGCSLGGPGGTDYFAVDGRRVYSILRDPTTGKAVAAVNSRAAILDNFPGGLDVQEFGFGATTGTGFAAFEYGDTAVEVLDNGSIQKILDGFSGAGFSVLATDGRFEQNLWGCNSDDLWSSRTRERGKLTVTSAVSAADGQERTVAPGGLLTVRGEIRGPGSDPGLAYNEPWPLHANGIEVTIGGTVSAACAVARPALTCQVQNGFRAPLQVVRSIGPNGELGQINVQVPFEVPAGVHPVRVWWRQTEGTESGAYYSDGTTTVTVAERAPSIFAGTVPAAVAAGEAVTLFATGLGQAAPALQTGQPTPAAAPAVAGVAVILGTTEVPAVATVLPGRVGIYVVQFTVPSGLTAGASNLTVRVGGGTASRPVPITLR